MPLRLNLKPNEQLMINGAVITNLKRRSFLAIHNHAQILPGRFVLKADRAQTPVRRVYFAAQMAYIFSEDPDSNARWSAEFAARWDDVMGVFANQTIRARLIEARACFMQRIYYRTLRLLHEVIEYEEKLFEVAGNRQVPAFEEFDEDAEDPASGPAVAVDGADPGSDGREEMRE